MTPAHLRSKVLFIGNDPLLSKATTALLRGVGYRVRSTNPLHAADAARDKRYTAVILCATLSKEETEQAVMALQEMQPGIPIVSIHVGLLGDAPHPASSVVVDASRGPRELISAVDSVSSQR
jgi:DNA-binding NtrC family response regulator